MALLSAKKYLRDNFGKLVTARDIRRVRRPLGDVWVIRVVSATGADVEVGTVDIDEQGHIEKGLVADAVMEALRRPPSTTPTKTGDESVDLQLDADAHEAPADPKALRARINQALARGGEALNEARELLPRLLAEPERRGSVLLMMAYVEQRMNNERTAMGYVEAAARELADRFDIDGLESAATFARNVSGDTYEGSMVHRLLEECRARLSPIASVFDAPELGSMNAEERAVIETYAQLATLLPGKVLLQEGEPSIYVMVVKSGLFGVYLNDAEGRRRRIRCCHPGWMLGETSVLVEGHPICSTTVVAERLSEVWRIDAEVMKPLLQARPELAQRIASTKATHRLASFFTMHAAIGQLHVKVRDRLIGCVAGVVRVDAETALLAVGEIPSAAALVAGGEVVIGDRVVAANQFVGVHDALHQVASGVPAVARAGTTLVLLDAQRLRQIALEDDQAAAVLEQL
jgi:CRP-like cAMP-binding protein